LSFCLKSCPSTNTNPESFENISTTTSLSILSSSLSRSRRIVSQLTSSGSHDPHCRDYRLFSSNWSSFYYSQSSSKCHRSAVSVTLISMIFFCILCHLLLDYLILFIFVRHRSRADYYTSMSVVLKSQSNMSPWRCHGKTFL
jgi:hypothetical protein